MEKMKNGEGLQKQIQDLSEKYLNYEFAYVAYLINIKRIKEEKSKTKRGLYAAKITDEITPTSKKVGEKLKKLNDDFTLNEKSRPKKQVSIGKIVLMFILSILSFGGMVFYYMANSAHFEKRPFPYPPTPTPVTDIVILAIAAVLGALFLAIAVYLIVKKVRYKTYQKNQAALYTEYKSVFQDLIDRLLLVSECGELLKYSDLSKFVAVHLKYSDTEAIFDVCNGHSVYFKEKIINDIAYAYIPSAGQGNQSQSERLDAFNLAIAQLAKKPVETFVADINEDFDDSKYAKAIAEQEAVMTEKCKTLDKCIAESGFPKEVGANLNMLVNLSSYLEKYPTKTFEELCKIYNDVPRNISDITVDSVKARLKDADPIAVLDELLDSFEMHLNLSAA